MPGMSEAESGRLWPVIGADPVPSLLAADEPAACWVTLRHVLGRPEDDADVRKARREVLADAGVQDLLERIPDWEVADKVGGHDSPRYAPNLLHLLADMGVRGDDDGRFDDLLDAFARHEDGGRFACFTQWRQMPGPVWCTLPCDTHIIADIMVRCGRAGQAPVRRSLVRILDDLTETTQGPGWKCIPDPVVRFRGPGRVADVCPLATLEALRLFARLVKQPAGATAADTDAARRVTPAVRTVLGVWRDRGAHKPYMFGHGRSFKTVKWPTTWYSVALVLDTVGRYPQVWSPASPVATEEDRRSVAELAACLIAYNVALDGSVTPRSCYKGFERFSFGQKRRPSPFAAARLLAILKPFEELADEIAAVDVAALPSSRGGSGTAQPSRVPGRS